MRQRSWVVEFKTGTIEGKMINTVINFTQGGITKVEMMLVSVDSRIDGEWDTIEVLSDSLVKEYANFKLIGKEILLTGNEMATVARKLTIFCQGMIWPAHDYNYDRFVKDCSVNGIVFDRGIMVKK